MRVEYPPENQIDQTPENQDSPFLQRASHRYPSEIIEEAVWLYFNFALSFREVEMM